MRNSIWSIVLATTSIFVLSACQTLTQNTNLINQTGQIAEMPVTTVSVDSDGDGVIDELDMCPSTQENAVVDERGCHITTGPEIGLKMEPRVFFAEGSSEVLPKYFSQLDQVGIKMREFDTANMRIEGNMSENEIDDSSLTAKSNTLAKNRALIVKNYLTMRHQIAPERITTFDCSSRTPIALNDTQEGRAMNRRVYGLVTRTDEEAYNDYQKYSQSAECVEF